MKRQWLLLFVFGLAFAWLAPHSWAQCHRSAASRYGAPPARASGAPSTAAAPCKTPPTASNLVRVLNPIETRQSAEFVLEGNAFRLSAGESAAYPLSQQGVIAFWAAAGDQRPTKYTLAAGQSFRFEYDLGVWRLRPAPNDLSQADLPKPEQQPLPADEKSSLPLPFPLPEFGLSPFSALSADQGTAALIESAFRGVPATRDSAGGKKNRLP